MDAKATDDFIKRPIQQVMHSYPGIEYREVVAAAPHRAEVNPMVET